MYTHISEEKAKQLFYDIKSGKICPYFTDVVVVPVGTNIHKGYRYIGYITGYQHKEFDVAVNCYIFNENYRGNKCTKVSYYLWEENTEDLKEVEVGIHTHFSSHDIQDVSMEDFHSADFMCGTDYSLGFVEDLDYIKKALIAKKDKYDYISIYSCDYYGNESKYKVKVDSVIHPNRVRPLYPIFKKLKGHRRIKNYGIIWEYLEYLFKDDSDRL